MTGTDLTLHNASLPDRMNYARALAESNLLPRHYQRQPANLLLALEYAAALGIAPINAITGIVVINGKPTASADLIASMIRKAGHKLRIEGDDTYATATLIRADDPDGPFTVTWGQDRAKRAGLWGNKGPWTNYPAAMLRARAITEVGRMGASDALLGISYTPEELGAEVDEEGRPVEAQEPERKAERSKGRPVGEDPWQTPAVAATPEPAPAAPVEPAEDVHDVEEIPQQDTPDIRPVAVQVARLALACDDADKIRDTYREASAKHLLDIDVKDELHDDITDLLALKTFTLGALLIAVGTYVKEQSMSIRDALAAGA